MCDYIKRENVKREAYDLDNNFVIDLCDVNSIPSEDVAQVHHGHWIKISPAGIYECSECGKNVMTSDIEAYEYCHGCGAKMEEE